MDILARIEQVIKQRGTNKTEVAERMGKAKQNFKSLLTNPKWDSLELVCQAMGIQPWQLFEQEIREAGYVPAAPSPSAGSESPSAGSESPSAGSERSSAGSEGQSPSEGQEREQGAEGLPFGNEEKEHTAHRPTALGMYACPYCGRGVTIEVKGV